MFSRPCLLSGLLLSLLAALTVAQAQTASDGTLHVLRPIIRAEQDKAELCLEFDHPLVAEDQTRVTATVKLESGLKTIPIASRNLSVNGSELCIPALEHREDYRLTLSNLHGAGGEKLISSYSLSFTVPPRISSLAFITSGSGNGLTRWKDSNPVLRAINVPYAKLELYRIADPQQMAEAWNQRMQTALAPSEVATFARSNGTSVWQSELSFGDAPDESVEQPVRLADQAGKSPPGLYLLIASAPELREKKSYLIPTAALWLLRSDLKLRALRAKDSLYALAEKADGSAPLKDVQVKTLDHNQQILAEGKSGNNGIASLSVPEDKRNDAVSVAGSIGSGDVDFFDLAQAEGNAVITPVVEADIATANTFYLPGEPVQVTLVAHDIHNHPVASKGSTLQLLRPDRSFYAAYPVPDDQSGFARVSFPAPVINGVCPIVWRQADGQILSEGKLRVTSNPDAPHLEMTADRALLAEDGEINVILKSITDAGSPAPYVAGHIEADWGVPDHIFPGWEGYRFGTGANDEHVPAADAFFVTDDKGVARVHLKPTPIEDASPLHAATLKVTSDPAAGVADPPELVVPMKPKNFIIGIKPTAAGGHFTENSLAHFDIVALDSDGKRHPAEDLNYQIYEQGRSFDWYQSEGRWEYKPLQQQRRIGGGALSLTGEGGKHIEWPVTAGAYRLEISDANGALLARMDFSAGWGLAKEEASYAKGLDLKPSTAVLQAGHSAEIHFTLEKPAMITAVIADDRVRAVMHVFKPEGDTTIAFMPAGDWGNRVGVWIDAEFQGVESEDHAVGQILLPLGSAIKNPASIPPHAKPRKLPLAAVLPLSLNADRDWTLRKIAEQTVASQHQWMPPVEKTHAKPEPRFLFLGPEHLYALPTIVAEVLDRHPFTTGEIADQIEVLRLWHDVIAASGLLPEQALRAEEDELAKRLIARQQGDGGFPLLPGGKSDFAGTAAALTILSQIQQPMTAPVVQQAADWLKHRLENTWFDEQERPLRAAAYAALAAADKLDPSSLHYFADAGTDKPMPPLAAVQLAAAFTKINDRDKANYWLGAAHVGKNASDIPAELLPLLAANPFSDPHDLLAALEKLSGDITKKPQDISNLTAFLRAMANVQNRAGDWRVSINKNDRNARGVLVLPWPEKEVAPVLRNISERPFYVSLAQEVKVAPPKSAIERRIYRLDGNEANGDLKQGETYVMMLQGPWPMNEKLPVFVHDDSGPALRPAGCVAEIPGNDFLAWLRTSPLTPLQACEQMGGTTYILIEHAEGASSWRVAYLVKAETAGAFDLQKPRARALSGNPAMLEGRKEQVRIK
jgi:uncharacterized protein YfaS (alpha-2-macroglobulin family)